MEPIRSSETSVEIRSTHPRTRHSSDINYIIRHCV
jgi:hypothetical protein